MNKRTAIFPLTFLPDDTAPEIDEDGNFVAVYVHLGAGYAELRCIDIQTAVNASTLPGPIEDHIDGFEVVE